MESFFGGLNIPPSSSPADQNETTLGESPPPLPSSSTTPPTQIQSNSQPPLSSTSTSRSGAAPPPPDTSKSENIPLLSPPPPPPPPLLVLPPPTPSNSFQTPDEAAAAAAAAGGGGGSSTVLPPPPPGSKLINSPPSNPSPQVPENSTSSSTAVLPLSPPTATESSSSPVINTPVPSGDAVANSLSPPADQIPSPTVNNPLPTPTKKAPTTTTGPSLSTTPPKPSDVSPNLPSLDSNSGFGYATAIVGVVLAGAVLVLFAFIVVVLRRKRRGKRKEDLLAVQYKPPSTYSGKSEGYYYKQANITNSVQFSTQSGPPLFPSATGTFGNQFSSSYSGPSGGDSAAIFGSSKSSFSYEEIVEMTQGFAEQNLLGEGGFGCVYKGRLSDGKVVAVKQLKAGSGQGEREFRAEVEIISRVHHRHLVTLVGYCISDHHRSLVYEFVPNNTLEHHLHAKTLPVMDWPTRLKISIGSARGLAYLHEDCHPRIIHRDIKSANILLDDSFEAQVADFGLAKLSNDTSTHVSTRVMGTFGYMAPEYASSGKLTDRSDVFSFGVVLLELITGRKPVDQSKPFGEESLVEWARPLMSQAFETGNFEELVDPRLENNYAKDEMFRMIEAAAACVRHSAPKRPRMAKVLRALDQDEGDQPADLSNGVKYGQSTVFDSKQYSADIQQFRRMAFGSDSYSSDYTEEYESNQSSTNQSGDYSSSRPLNSRWKS